MLALALAQNDVASRGVFLTQAFLVLLIAAGLLIGLYFLACLVLLPITAAIQTPDAAKFRRLLIGYLIAGPLTLVNLVAVFGLFLVQFFAVQWAYNNVAGPQKVLERALASTGLETDGRTPEAIVLEKLKDATGFESGGYLAPTTWTTQAAWLTTTAVNWGIVLFLLFAMMRDLGLTSWTLLAAPIQREFYGTKWWDLVRVALSRFLHLIGYTALSTGFFLFCAGWILVVSWITMRMVAGMLVTYLAELERAGGGLMPFLLFGSFNVTFFEVLLLFFFTTGTLAFIASRSISLNVEDVIDRCLDLPRPVKPPALWKPTLSAALLLGKMALATLPVYLLMAWIVTPLLPWIVSGPLGAFLHLVAFNVALLILKAHKDVKTLLVEAWAGRPWKAWEEDKEHARAAAKGLGADAVLGDVPTGGEERTSEGEKAGEPPRRSPVDGPKSGEAPSTAGG